MTTNITFYYHTQGKFVRDENRKLFYVGGTVNSVPPMDIDFVNYFDLVELFKSLGYHDLTAMYWMHPNYPCLNSGLNKLSCDNDINLMCEAAIKSMKSNECSVHLYIEHPVLGLNDVEIVEDIEIVEDLGTNSVEDVPIVEDLVDDVASEDVEDLGTKSVLGDVETSEDSTYIPTQYNESDDTDLEEILDGELEKLSGKKKSASPIKKCSKKKDVVVEEGSDDSRRMSFEINGYASYSEGMRTPISTDDEGNSRPIFPMFRESTTFGQVNLVLGMEFENLEIFKNAVKDYNINLGRQFVWKKNDSGRARAVCKDNDCPWVAYCSRGSNDKAYQIKTLDLEHTCSRVFTNKAADRDWVASKLEKRLLTQPDLKRRHVYDIMKDEFHVHLNDKVVSRALKKARMKVEGSEKEQYGKTWNYLGELLRSNPGSTAKMDVLRRPRLPPLFQRLYICLDACKKGFKAGCRPLIGLDGCFLTGYYGGQLLSAVGQDANNQFYVIAYAVVDSETKENWKWFLTLLLDDLGDYKTFGWNFISDQQKVCHYSACMHVM